MRGAKRSNDDDSMADNARVTRSRTAKNASSSASSLSESTSAVSSSKDSTSIASSTLETKFNDSAYLRYKSKLESIAARVCKQNGWNEAHSIDLARELFRGLCCKAKVAPEDLSLPYPRV
ncbi:hypothetical protein HDU76_010504 [Blyttiomyces sp. JEL0837]|nr:hypothetical protein HDU76_010504 [Blyttiomyces sp. JEL0837]